MYPATYRLPGVVRLSPIEWTATLVVAYAVPPHPELRGTLSAAEHSDGPTFVMRSPLAQIFIGGTITLVSIACGASPASPAAADLEARPTGAVSSAPTAASAAPADDSAPAARPETPEPKFAGFDFALNEGTFWEYRWEAKSSFFAARGSNSDSDSGTFKVSLWAQKEIDGVVAYEVKVTGKHQVDDEDRSFAPRWRYIGMADDKILVSLDGQSMVVLFDAGAGEWPGSGFFTTRMKAETLQKARSGTLSGPSTDWPGVKGGPVVAVSHSTDKAQCKTYASVGRVCGNESLAYNEREMYRGGIGPVAYSYSFSMSQGSGTSSFSSSASEHLALVASSLRGDAAASESAGVMRRPAARPAPVRPIGGTPGTVRRRAGLPTPLPGTGASAAEGRIVFSSERDGNGEIYVVNADGSGLTRLTVNQVNDSAPAFSPDGTQVAFISDRDGDKEVFVMTTGGTNQSNLTKNSVDDTEPSWSPDGTKIAFTSNREAGFNVYLMNADGSHQGRLTFNDGSENTSPAWSPDGETLAFVSFRGNTDVFIVDASGSGEKRLTSDPGDDFTPAWSPDGTSIAFTSFRDGNAEIYVVKADGSRATRLTTDSGADWSPSWSPDGAWIAFESERDGNRDIYVMRADGSGVTRLTNNRARDTWPSWAPFGQ